MCLPIPMSGAFRSCGHLRTHPAAVADDAIVGFATWLGAEESIEIETCLSILDGWAGIGQALVWICSAIHALAGSAG